METVKITIEQEAVEFLEEGLQELREDLYRAKHFLVDGKVIHCDRKLQRALTKCDMAITYISEVQSGNMATKISPEKVISAESEERPKE